MQLDTVVCGDCLDVMRDIPDGCVDLIVTSPRYNVRMDYGETCTDFTDWETYYREIRNFLNSAYRILVSGGVIAINVPKEVRLRREDKDFSTKRVEKISTRIEVMCEEIGFLPRESIVWIKGLEDTGPISTTYAMGSDNNIYIRPVCEMILLHSKERYFYDNGTGRRGTKDVPFLDETKDVWWNIPARRNGHPSPFPIDIPERLIRMFTCLKDGARVPIIFDPFMGSGTTAEAAFRTKRRFYGCDVNPAYVELANQRIAKARAEMAQMEMNLP